MLYFVLLSLISLVSGVNISNVVPKRDTSGAILDAHDSAMILQDGVYYWFAASYGNCTEPSGDSGCDGGLAIGRCGFRTNHNVTLYTSPDLTTWTNAGVVFGAEGNLPPNSVLYAPKTVYNANTKQYVMWFNYIVGDFSHSYYGVATSPTVKGPFVIKTPQVETLAYNDNGDEGLFVDDDGTAYLVYSSLSIGHTITVEQLTPDYLNTLGKAGNSGPIGSGNQEAPVMFKRNNIYYLGMGTCCCYCGPGSPITIYTAASPLGPYTARTSLGDLRSQSTAIFSYVGTAGESGWMYIGDHWQSAPDGLKSHDFTVWAPLIFSEDGLSVTTAGFQDSFLV